MFSAGLRAFSGSTLTPEGIEVLVRNSRALGWGRAFPSLEGSSQGRSYGHWVFACGRHPLGISRSHRRVEGNETALK